MTNGYLVIDEIVIFRKNIRLPPMQKLLNELHVKLFGLNILIHLLKTSQIHGMSNLASKLGQI